MKKIIVTQRIDYIDNYNETRESIDQALIELLIKCNFIPIPISNKLITYNLCVQLVKHIVENKR